MEVMVAKILLKFGAAQATCGDDDDDDHITSRKFKSKWEKYVAEWSHIADVRLYWLTQLCRNGCAEFKAITC